MTRLKKQVQLVTATESQKVTMAPASAAGTPRPSLPRPVFGEDFSFMIRLPRRLRIKRGKIHVLH